MRYHGLTEEQIIKNYLRKVFREDFVEIKLELRAIRKELARISYPPKPELLTVREVCEILKLSKPSVNRLINEKKRLKAVRLLDQDLRFLRSDVEALIKSSYKG